MNAPTESTERLNLEAVGELAAYPAELAAEEAANSADHLTWRDGIARDDEAGCSWWPPALPDLRTGTWFLCRWFP